MRSGRFLTLAIAAIALAGCARGEPPKLLMRGASGPLVTRPVVHPMLRVAPGPVAAAPARVMAAPMVPVAAPPPVVIAEPAEAPYTLDSGDRLRVVVFGQEGLTSSYAVDASGRITMPLIGAVPARGLTTAELQQSISGRLRQGYIREPHVAVEVETYRPFFILGEVTAPGQYAYVPNMTVETAVAIAGGFSPRAFKKKIELHRPVDGMTARVVVHPTYPLRPGDTIIVAERWF
jgi:polysaccharide biosynthesis/export protein